MKLKIYENEKNAMEMQVDYTLLSLLNHHFVIKDMFSLIS